MNEVDSFYKWMHIKEKIFKDILDECMSMQGRTKRKRGKISDLMNW